LEAINIQEEYSSSNLNLSSKRAEPHQKNTPQHPPQNNMRSSMKVKKMLSSKTVKVIFDDDLNKGSVSMFQVGSRKYLIYEAESGELLLLDKFETSRKTTKKTQTKATHTSQNKTETVSKQNLDNIEAKKHAKTNSQLNAIFN